VRASTLLRAAGVAVLPALAACGGDARVAGPVVRDSAGVQIVENGAPAWKQGQEWRLSAEPTLDIGMLDGPTQYQFGDIAGVVRLGDGTVVVGDDQSKDLRFFDRTGRHVRSVGREGGGPGEFKAVRNLFSLEDTLVVGDWNSRRVSVFAPDGRFVRAIPLEGKEFTFPAGYFRGGALLLRAGTTFDSGSRSGLTRDSITYLRLDPAGGPPTKLGRFPGPESWVQTNGGGIMVTSPAFGRASKLAAVPDGFFFGSADAHEIRRYDAAGRLVRLIRRREALRPVTPADVDRYKQMLRKDAEASKEPFIRQMLERSLAEMPFPETMPAHGDLRVDRAGNLWVSDFQLTGEDAGRWTVFDPQGRMLGAVATPPRFQLHDIGTDYVAGVWKDELDVEHVRVFSLEKPGADS
jgi:hypothetical protein